MTFEKTFTFNWNILSGSNGNFMHRNMTENTRKRSREEDTCEFMPLSKRINNLHINNNVPGASISHFSQSQIPCQFGWKDGWINSENGISLPRSSDTERKPNYDPGVNSSQSNYYYENKLLFELHLERIQRSGQQFPF